MNYIRRMVSEAHRRSLWQVFGVYVALAWGVYQVIKELTELFGLPDWVPGLAIVLLLIGLPIVLATAFVQEGGPGKRELVSEPSDPTLLPMSDATSTVERRAPDRFSTQKHHLLFTWQRALLGGLAAFLLLGITAGGYMGMRNAGVGPFGSLLAAGELSAREPILIAEFSPLNGDSTLARTVTEAFRVDFAQTSSVTVVQPRRLQAALERMSRPQNARLDADLAHEVAIRDNIKSYLVGEVSQAGSRYVVATRLIATRDGRVLASYRETAANADDIIGAVDRLSKKMRNKIGESLKSIRAEKPLELVSTPSLEALQKYTQGAYAIDVDRDFDTGISLLEEAIALDTAFAMAWRKLAVAYANGDRGEDKRLRAVLKAYSFRDRLPDLERYNTAGFYYYALKQDYQKAASAYEMLAERDPTWPPNNLGIVYMRMREPRKALETFKRTMALDSTLTTGYLNVIDAYVEIGARDSAERAVNVLAERFGAEVDVVEKRMFIAAAFRDYEKVAQVLGTEGLQLRDPWLRARMYHNRADLLMVNGRIRESERLRALAVEAEVDRGQVVRQLSVLLWRAAYTFNVEQDEKRARALLDDALRKYPLEQFAALDRPYQSIVAGYGVLGDRERAEYYLRHYEQSVPEDLREDTGALRSYMEGALAFQERRYSDAIAAWRRADRRSVCNVCTDYELALAFEQAGATDSAIARLEHYVKTPSSRVFWEDTIELGVTYERLADLYAARGDTENALLYAGRFVELWQNADPELQARVRAKREMIRQLQRS